MTNKGYGRVVFGGQGYILTQEPFCDCLPGEALYFQASACPAEIWGTEEGNDPANLVTVAWDVIPGTEDDRDDGHKCDWDHPDYVW